MDFLFRSEKPYDGLYEYLLETEKTLILLDTPAKQPSDSSKTDPKEEYIRNYVFQLLERIKYEREDTKRANAEQIMNTICKDFGYYPSNLPECYKTVNSNIEEGKFNKMLEDAPYVHTKPSSKSPSKSHVKSFIKKTLSNLNGKGGRRTKKRKIQNRRRKTQSKYT